MALCSEVQDNLLIQLDEGIIDDQEFLYLWDINNSSNLHFRVHD